MQIRRDGQVHDVLAEETGREEEDLKVLDLTGIGVQARDCIILKLLGLLL